MGNSYTLPQNIKYSIEGKKARLQWPTKDKSAHSSLHLTNKTFNATTRDANFIEEKSQWFVSGGIDDCRPFFEMKQVAASFELAASKQSSSASVDVDKLPIIYKLLYTIQHEAKGKIVSRDPIRTYTHKISRAEMIALAILAGVDHHLTYDSYCFPGRSRPEICEQEEQKKSRAHHLQKRDERAMTLEKELQEDIKSQCKVAKMRINGHLNDLLKITREDLQNLTIKGNLREEERIYFLSVVRDYLRSRCRTQGLLRGDLISFVKHDGTGRGLSIYDGKNIVDLDGKHSVFPEQFLASIEFSPFYWYGDRALEGKNVNINPCLLTIERVTIEKVTVGIEIPCLVFLTASYQGQSFDYFTVGREMNTMPSVIDIKNHFCTCKYFLPLCLPDGKYYVYMGRFHQSELNKALQPLQEEHKIRTAVIQSCNFLLPELRAVVADYTIEYYT